jgi:hypothetical protein
MRFAPVILALALGTTGCAVRNPSSPGVIPSAAEWSQKVTKNRDNYKKAVTTEGAVLSSGRSKFFLRAVEMDAEPAKPSMVVYVMSVYDGDWRFYRTANTIDGKRWEPMIVDRSVLACSRYGGCSHAEHLVIDFGPSYLQSNVETGIDFKISGKGGEESFYLPPNYIAAILASVPEKK